MKKLNMSDLGLNIQQLLSKEQLKNITGGSGSGQSYMCTCYNDTVTKICAEQGPTQAYDVCSTICHGQSNIRSFSGSPDGCP